MMKLGDKVVVNKTYNVERKTYPFMPNICGMKGSIVDVITHSPMTRELLDMPIYKVKFEKQFLVGILPEGECPTFYRPKDFAAKDTWMFCMHLDLV